MENYLKIVKRLAQQTKVDFKSASAENLAAFAKLGVPESVLTFYRSFEPQECAENPNEVRLSSITHILKENSDFVPGCYTAPQGYIVFASTITGDTYCFDVNSLNPQGEPRIVLIPHDELEEDSPAEEIKKIAKPIANNLFEFLEQFSRNECDEECLTNAPILLPNSF